jgi:nuclease-like protein
MRWCSSVVVLPRVVLAEHLNFDHPYARACARRSRACPAPRRRSDLSPGPGSGASTASHTRPFASARRRTGGPGTSRAAVRIRVRLVCEGVRANLLAGVTLRGRHRRFGGARGRFNYGKRDHYGRIVGKVLTSGTDAGLRQVETGLAWHYKRYEQEQSDWDRPACARAEVQARAERRGLWRDPEPVPRRRVLRG